MKSSSNEIWFVLATLLLLGRDTMTKATVLVRVSIPVQNIMIKKQVREKTVYSAYTSILLFITKGTQDWNSSRAEAGADAEAMAGCYLLACFSWFAKLAFL